VNETCSAEGARDRSQGEIQEEQLEEMERTSIEEALAQRAEQDAHMPIDEYNYEKYES
tara:strand:- start:919 stop:1092 length:174 start_codon:yes stop_codon:yes gene_type:complete